MADQNQRLALDDLRSGRNNVDPPQVLSDSHVVEAVNVDWFNATFGRKRNGVTSLTTTSSPFTGQTYSSLYRHVPTTDETLAELWATDDAATPHVGRLTGGIAWATPTLKDAPTGNGWDFSYASLNGKLFIAYKSAVDRLHVWDPVSNSVRRTGLAVMAAPTAADDGSGGYPAVLRFYRTRATELRSGVVVRRSEPSAPSAAFTPSGSGDGVLITRGTPPSEGETHWEVEESTDGVTYYRIATVVIGTTTFLDIVNAATVSSNPLSAVTGFYGLQTSFRSIAADQGRLLGFGNYTTTDPQNQVVYSAVIGSTNVGDEERVPLNNFIGLDENDSGAAIGIKGPIGGSFFALKYRQLFKLTPTGDPTTPYAVLKLSPTVGAISMHSIVVGEDEVGNASLYWMSSTGPYRWSSAGIEYLGRAVEDKTIGENSGTSLNLAATHVGAHSRWVPLKRQLWFWIATGSNNDPDTVLCFTIGRTAPYYGGYSTEPGIKDAWSIFTGGIATARCSTLFAGTVGAAMSRDLYPYIGSSATTNTIGKADFGTQDFSANYQGVITSKAYSPWSDGWTGTILGAQLTGKAAAGVAIQLTTVCDYGLETRSDSCTLTPTASESRVQPRFGGGITAAGKQCVQFTVGDPIAVNAGWTIDSLNVVWKKEGPVAA